jgi:hypothetical protein
MLSDYDPYIPLSSPVDYLFNRRGMHHHMQACLPRFCPVEDDRYQHIKWVPDYCRQCSRWTLARKNKTLPASSMISNGQPAGRRGMELRAEGKRRVGLRFGGKEGAMPVPVELIQSSLMTSLSGREPPHPKLFQG